MKIFAIPRKTAVAVVVVWTVLGALLGHDYPTAGLVVSLGSIGYYLLLVGRRRIGYLLNLDRTTERQRLLVATAACMLYVLIRAVLTARFPIFCCWSCWRRIISSTTGTSGPARADSLPPVTGSKPGQAFFEVKICRLLLFDYLCTAESAKR